MSAYNKISFHIAPKKALPGAALGLAALLLSSAFTLPLGFGLAVGLIFAALGCIKLESDSHILAAVIQLVWGLLILTACVQLCSMALQIIFFSGYVPLERSVLWLNRLFALTLAGLLYLVTGSIPASTLLCTLLMTAMAASDVILYTYRNRELMASDLLAFGTAMNVAGSYDYNIHPFFVAILIICALLVFCFFSLPTFRPKRPLLRRLTALAVTAAALLSMYGASRHIDPESYGNDASVINGLYLNFFLSLRDSFVRAPEGYSQEAAEALASRYAGNEDSSLQSKKQPNIIVVMNEAFSDPEIFENFPETSQPVLPFFKSLTADDNCISGHALCSVFGGNTANSEFEFLMGHSMGFIPNGSSTSPYQLYLGSGHFTLPRYLSSLGYDTTATHPYTATGWSRNMLYPLFGFEECIFVEAYPKEQLCRGLVSDREFYEFLLNMLKDEAQEAPLFTFGISMQNHGNYLYQGEEWQQSISIPGNEGLYPQAEQYLSLLHESDKALEYFIEELSDFEEETIVLFFGDHLPKIEEEFYALINNGPLEDPGADMKRYQIPFFIWANFDIPEYQVELTSINYLSRYLLEEAGIELSPYYRFLKSAEEVIPAVNAYGYYSREQDGFVGISEAAGEEAQTLKDYAILQYNNVFDTKNLSDTAYGKYMN